ncbi:MAG: ABC transporter permease, partial [Chloroflexi bacterium]|nr:ABC transporter permease [Chloroflexota bacterium]
MEELFGLDMQILMVIMLVAFLVIMVAVGFTALLNRIMFKIGVRNIPRRPAQTVLIIIGLMLSTLIISAALGTGDTLSFSIRNEVITGLGEIDELLTSGRSVDLDDFRSDPYFPVAQFEELRASIGDDDRIDGLAPMIAETAPVVNPVARQSAGSMKITAVDPAEVGIFGPILSMSGSPVRLEDLEGNEVFINEAAAEELEAGTGDTLQLFVQGDTVELVVRDVVQKGGLAGNHETMLISLSRAQEIFGVPGQINSILVSNRGDSKDGAELSDEVTEYLRGLLTNREVAERLTVTLNDAGLISEIR